MENTLLDIRLWVTTWSPDGRGRSYLDEDALLWGEQGFRDMTRRLASVTQDIEAITALLACRDIRSSQIYWKELGRNGRRPTDVEILEWRQVLSQQTEEGRASILRRLDCSRFLFAIYRNTELKEKIKSLQ